MHKLSINDSFVLNAWIWSTDEEIHTPAPTTTPPPPHPAYADSLLFHIHQY